MLGPFLLEPRTSVEEVCLPGAAFIGESRVTVSEMGCECPGCLSSVHCWIYAGRCLQMMPASRGQAALPWNAEAETSCLHCAWFNFYPMEFVSVVKWLLYTVGFWSDLFHSGNWSRVCSSCPPALPSYGSQMFGSLCTPTLRTAYKPVTQVPFIFLLRQKILMHELIFLN